MTSQSPVSLESNYQNPKLPRPSLPSLVGHIRTLSCAEQKPALHYFNAHLLILGYSQEQESGFTPTTEENQEVSIIWRQEMVIDQLFSKLHLTTAYDYPLLTQQISYRMVTTVTCVAKE
jgi:hypothetical protein